jgi:hypothetical protein
MMYVSPMPKHGKRKLCKHPYSKFKREGSLAMPPEFVTRYPFLKEFAKANIQTDQYLIKLYEISGINFGDANKNIIEFKASLSVFVTGASNWRLKKRIST